MRLSFFVGLSLTVLLVLGSGLYWGYQALDLGSPAEEEPGQLLQRVNDEERVQFLLLHAPDDSLRTAYLASYDSISGRMSAIYLSPDFRIMSPSYGEVMSLRELHDQFSPDETRRELESALELEIPFWVKSSDNDVRRLVDAMGGLEVEFPVRASRDSDSSRTQQRWLDGHQSQNYVKEAYQRFRSQGRRFRHKTFFLGLREKINNRTTFFEHPRTLGLVDELFESNLQPSDWRTLVHLMNRLEPDKIKFPSSLHLMKGGSERTTLDPEPLKNMLPKPLKRMIREAKPQSTIDVQVLNGAGLPELAGAVRDKIQPNSRVDVVEVGNADRYNYETTRIVDRSNNPESANHLRDLLGTGSIESNPSDKLLVDVTVIVGKDLSHLIKPN